jgi:hypothetical protein
MVKENKDERQTMVYKENEYAGIVTDHEEKDYFFFQNSKMMLYHCEVSMYIQLYLP